LRHKVRVTSPHVFARVAVRASGDHRQERALFAGLIAHVDLHKEACHALVVKHALVEKLNGRLDGWCAAEALIQAGGGHVCGGS
jgi:hypothetical protein